MARAVAALDTSLEFGVEGWKRKTDGWGHGLQKAVQPDQLTVKRDDQK